MAKKLYRETTEADLHKIATMVAAGIRNHPIVLATGMSPHAVAKAQQLDEWPAILAAKREALERLMRGEA